MNPITRRRFLQLAGGTLGASLAGCALPPSVRRAAEIAPARRKGTIEDVEHVVILMQENRSFDHYFGTMRGVRGFGDPRPLQWADGRSVWHQPNARIRTPTFQARGVPPDAPYVLPFHIDTQRTGDQQDGTDHSWSTGHQAWNHGRWNDWVTQKQDALTMGHLQREDLAFHFALAEAFTICDSYFSSAHADTAINRIYLWSGTSDPRNVMGPRRNGPGLEERGKINGYSWTTYPERLQRAGVSWKLYQGGTGDPGSPTDNYTDNSLEFFAQYQIAEGADPDGPLVRQGVSNHTLAELRDDVLQGRLPQVSWIVAPYKYSEHPEASHIDGAYYINRVLEALTADPEVWSRTVLFLNYDENDGLFDHVVPPMPPLHSAPHGHGMVSPSLVESLQDEILDLDVHTSMIHPLVPGADPGGRQPIGLGARVPMIVVSPWSAGGWVCSETFDHTSVLRFLETRFGVAEPNISAWRRSVCGDLTSAFDFAGTASRALPQFQSPAHHQGAVVPITVPAHEVMPTQEPGVRPARALPYAWRIDAQQDEAQVWLEFANEGAAGAWFYVYDGTAPDDAPRRYTVAAAESLRDGWPLRDAAVAYDLTLHGANGYLAQVRGERQATVQATPHRVAGERQLRLRLRNDGKKARMVEVVDTYGDASPQRRTLPATGEAELVFDLAASQGWYDLSVTLAGSPHYLRRFAGHIEDGRPSISDPGGRGNAGADSAHHASS